MVDTFIAARWQVRCRDNRVFRAQALVITTAPHLEPQLKHVVAAEE